MTLRNTYKAGEFAERLGVSQDSLRDWRRRGISLGGVMISASRDEAMNERGTVNYDDAALVEGVVMLHIHARYPFDLLPAYNMAKFIAPLIANRRGMVVDETVLPDSVKSALIRSVRFACFPTGGRAIYTDDLNDCAESNRAFVTVINLERMTHELEEVLRDKFAG